MLTSQSEAFILYDIVHKVRPNGLLIKSDFDGDGLLEAFDAVVEGNTYYTETVRESIKERLLSQGLLDSVDRQIITLISEGFQIKTIAETMNLFQDTIKKRKSKIKDLLGIDKGNDEDILKECRHLRLI
jgi:DNA-binding NarL/FixJ family response regulator